MPSKKKLEELEYNVFKKDMDNNPSVSENLIGSDDKGCLTTLAIIVVMIVIIVFIVGFAQVGRNGPAITCAATGCSNRVKPGSNYCWLHSGSQNSRPKRSSSSSSGGSSGGSVIGGSSGGAEGDTPKKKSKIWSGSNRNEGSSSSGDSKNN